MLIDTVAILQTSYAADAHSAMGAATVSTYLDGVKARIQPLSAAESIRHGRESNRAAWRIFVAPSQGITDKMQVQFTDNDGTTRTLDIVEVTDLQTMDVVTRLICEETDGGG